MPADHELLGEALATERPLLENDVTTHAKFDPAYQDYYQSVSSSNNNNERRDGEEECKGSLRRSVFIYPLKGGVGGNGGGRVVGLLEITRRYRDELQFDEQYLAQVMSSLLGFEIGRLREREELAREFALKESLKPLVYGLQLHATTRAEVVTIIERGVEACFGVSEARLLLVHNSPPEKHFSPRGGGGGSGYSFEIYKREEMERVEGGTGIAHWVLESEMA